MGMFVNIRCDRIMPDGSSGSDRDFQTKDLDCCLETFIITEAGHLTKNRGHYEERDVDLNYHGYIRFYDDVEYIAKFTDGLLVNLEVLNDENKKNK